MPQKSINDNPQQSGLAGAAGEEVLTPRSERLKLKRNASDSSLPGFYQALSGNKRKSRSSDGPEDESSENTALNALVRSRSSPAANSKPPNPEKKKAARKTGGSDTRRQEEEGAAALLGLLGSESAPPVGDPIPNPVRPGAFSHVRGVLNQGLAAVPYVSHANPPHRSPSQPSKKPAVKRRSSAASRRSAGTEEPLLDIKLPEGNGPWEGIVVTLRHGKYKGKSANVLGLAKKKYRVQVEGLDYQLEFYPSYVGLPEPPIQDESADDNKSSLKRTTTNTSNANIVVANVERSPSALTRVPSGSSDGSKGSKSVVTATSLESYRSWIGKTVMVKRGKYQGRRAWVLGLASEKLRVVVDNVEHQLEYYPTMFEPPQAQNQVAPQSTSVQLAPTGPLPTTAALPSSAGLARINSGASNNAGLNNTPPPMNPASTGLFRAASCGSQGTEAVARPAVNSGKPPTPNKSPVQPSRVDVN